MICLKLVNTDKVNCTVLRYYAILRLWDAGKRRPFCTANRRFVWPGTSLCTRSHTCWLLAWSCLIYVHVFTYIICHFGDMATTWWTHESSICAISVPSCVQIQSSLWSLVMFWVRFQLTLPDDHASQPDCTTVPDHFFNTSTYQHSVPACSCSIKGWQSHFQRHPFLSIDCSQCISLPGLQGCMC